MLILIKGIDYTLNWNVIIFEKGGKNMKVIRGQYGDYVKFNGEKYADSPLALTIKDNECDYYLIYDGKNIFSDVVVFPEENNLINLNITLDLEKILEVILKELKKNYTYLTFTAEANSYNSLELIREKCNVEDEYTEKLDGKYEMTYIKVNL